MGGGRGRPGEAAATPFDGNCFALLDASRGWQRLAEVDRVFLFSQWVDRQLLRLTIGRELCSVGGHREREVQEKLGTGFFAQPLTECDMYPFTCKVLTCTCAALRSILMQQLSTQCKMNKCSALQCHEYRNAAGPDKIKNAGIQPKMHVLLDSPSSTSPPKRTLN